MPYYTNDYDVINHGEATPFDADAEVSALKERTSALEGTVDVLADYAIVTEDSEDNEDA